MNYGRIASGIAVVLMVGCVLAILLGIVGLWLSDAPVAICIGATLFVGAVGVMVLFFELDERAR